MFLPNKFLNKEKKIQVTRFDDEKSEPLFLCEKRKSFFRRLKEKRYFSVNSDLKSKCKKAGILFLMPIFTITILTGGICISINKCNKQGMRLFNAKPQIVAEDENIKNIELLLAINGPKIKEKKFDLNDICKFENIECNKIIIKDLKEMLDAAKKDGLNLKLSTGYIDESFRKSEYEKNLAKLLEEGHTHITAEAEAKKNTYKYFENETGLSVNFSSSNKKDFMSTEEYKWLVKNAVEYGFVLRSPKEKEGKTGINFDPTFFRYVGKVNAQKMRMLSMCLEEYRNYLKIN